MTVVVKPVVLHDEKLYSDWLKLRADLVKNAYLRLPILKGDHDDWMQIGREQVTDVDWCGKNISYYVCSDVDTHTRVGTFQDVDYAGKFAVTHGHVWCKKKGCPICFLDGWVGDRARSIWGKLAAGILLGLGPVEHGVVSFSREDLVLPTGMNWFDYEAVLRRRVIDGLKSRGVTGAVLVCHARRIANRGKIGFRYLKFSLHYHWVGLIGGGYDICRKCPYLVCGSNREWCANEEFCKGWEQRTRRAYESDGLIVRVMGKRASGLTEEESVMKTVRYILSHASYLQSFRKRFYVISSMGRLANKKIKAVEVKAVHYCPVCASVGVKNEAVKSVYKGEKCIVDDVCDPLYVRCFACSEFDESGRRCFEEYHEGFGDLGG